MNNRTPQQVAADYVKSNYDEFYASPGWVSTVPDPRPVGWIDLANVPSHPRHAMAMKRMIFESQHPDLFNFKEKQVTFPVLQLPRLVPPGFTLAQCILPAPGNFYLQPNWAATKDCDSTEYLVDRLIFRIPKLRPAIGRVAQAVDQPVLAAQAAPVAQQVPVALLAVPGSQKTAAQTYSHVQPSAGSQQGAAQTHHQYQQSDIQPNVNKTPDPNELLTKASSKSQKRSTKALACATSSQQKSNDDEYSKSTEKGSNGSQGKTPSLSAPAVSGLLMNANMLANASGFIGSDRQLAKKLKEMEAAGASVSLVQQDAGASLKPSRPSIKKPSKYRKRAGTEWIDRDEQPCVASSSGSRQKLKTIREEPVPQEEHISTAFSSGSKQKSATSQESFTPPSRGGKTRYAHSQQLAPVIKPDEQSSDKSTSESRKRPYISPYGPVQSAEPHDQSSTGPTPNSLKKCRTPPRQSDTSTGQPCSAEKKEKGASWTQFETSVLGETLRTIRAEEEAAGVPKNETKRFNGLYEEASKRMLESHGIHRTWAAIKNHWSRNGRELTRYDERFRQNPDMLATSLQKPKGRK